MVPPMRAGRPRRIPNLPPFSLRLDRWGTDWQNRSTLRTLLRVRCLRRNPSRRTLSGPNFHLVDDASAPGGYGAPGQGNCIRGRAARRKSGGQGSVGCQVRRVGVLCPQPGGAGLIGPNAQLWPAHGRPVERHQPVLMPWLRSYRRHLPHVGAQRTLQHGRRPLPTRRLVACCSQTPCCPDAGGSMVGSPVLRRGDERGGPLACAGEQLDTASRRNRRLVCVRTGRASGFPPPWSRGAVGKQEIGHGQPAL